MLVDQPCTYLEKITLDLDLGIFWCKSTNLVQIAFERPWKWSCTQPRKYSSPHFQLMKITDGHDHMEMTEQSGNGLYK